MWQELYFGKATQKVIDIANNAAEKSLYILTDYQGIEFEDDGLRDGEHLRAWMTDKFENLLQENGLPFTKISSCDLNERLAIAVKHINDTINLWLEFSAITLKYSISKQANNFRNSTLR